MSTPGPVAAGTARTPGAPGRRALVVVFVGLNLGMLLSTLDGTIVATALPSIVRDLGGVSGITWVVTSYLLAQVASMPLYGKLGDVYGRKRVFVVAVVLFTIGSMLCGAAGSMGQLLAARSVQGLGAGGLATLAMAIIADLVPPRQLGRWLGYQGAIFAVGGVAGPLTGGLFVDELSWRWAFYATAPLAVVSVALVGFTLRVPYRRIPHAIDYLGSALLTGAVVALVVLATVAGNDVAWVSPATVALGAAVVLLTVAFIRRERRVAEPFVPVRLLTNAVVRASGGLNFMSGLVFYCGIFFVPVFLQDVAGVSALASGLLLIPLMSATALATLVAGRGVERSGRYRIWPILGSLCMGAGLALLATMQRGTPVAVASAFGAVVGTGVGFVMQTSLLALQNRVDPAELGIATSTALLARTLGGTIGTSVFGAVLAAGLPADHAHAADYARALPAVFLVAIPFAALSLLAALRLPEHPLGEQARFALDVVA
jgi:EmrB/QacA subfamily drug resistance transporter